MEASAAPELDGARIQVPSAPEVWLVYHGMRHHITSPSVYEAMFSSVDLLQMDSVDQILRGPDLVEGTCLVRAEEGGGIYLVTGFPDTEIRKHYIYSFETLKDFGFDEAKVRLLPRLVLAGLPLGRDIRSAAD